MLAGFECTGIIEILQPFEDGPVDPTTPSPHLGSSMEQREHRRGCPKTPLSVDRIGPVMKRAALAMALSAGFFVGGAIAQTPPWHKADIT
jgi:hypothetical protein